jgi:peptidase S41-like protein
MGRLGRGRAARGLATLAAIVGLVGMAVTPDAASSAGVPGAAADVRQLAEQMEAIHPNLFATVSKARFRSAVSSLVAKAGTLSEDELIVELMRLAALPGNRNGHGGIFPGDPAHRRTMHFYPVRLYAFADGTYVVDDDEGGRLIGLRPVIVGGRPWTEVERLVRPLVPHDNGSSLKGLLPHYALGAEVLDGLGIADGVAPLRFGFARRDGSRVDVTLSPVDTRRYVALFPNPGYGHYPSLLPSASAPMYVAHDDEALWMRTIDGGRAVFVGYNSVTVSTDGAAKRLLSLVSRPKVRRVIVDLRLNGGGDNTTMWPLVEALRNPRVNRTGRLYVLIGRATFSAAGNFAAELDRSTRAIFVGEPTGGGVKMYGDARPVALPNTGIQSYVPARYWDFGTGPKDRRLAVNPGLPVALGIADFLARRDPVLDAALRSAGVRK